jgi:hypothetical protein
MKLKGRRFETVSGIQRKSQAILDDIMENDFHCAFEVWGEKWNRCIHSQGNYFEKLGSQH